MLRTRHLVVIRSRLVPVASIGLLRANVASDETILHNYALLDITVLYSDNRLQMWVFYTNNFISETKPMRVHNNIRL